MGSFPYNRQKYEVLAGRSVMKTVKVMLDSDSQHPYLIESREVVRPLFYPDEAESGG